MGRESARERAQERERELGHGAGQQGGVGFCGASLSATRGKTWFKWKVWKQVQKPHVSRSTLSNFKPGQVVSDAWLLRWPTPLLLCVTLCRICVVHRVQSFLGVICRCIVIVGIVGNKGWCKEKYRAPPRHIVKLAGIDCC